MGGIDKARAFPVQKNKTVIHHSSKDEKDAGENPLTPSTSPDEKKPLKKLHCSLMAIVAQLIVQPGVMQLYANVLRLIKSTAKNATYRYLGDVSS